MKSFSAPIAVSCSFLAVLLFNLLIAYFSPLSAITYLLLSIFLIVISFSVFFMGILTINLDHTSPLTLLGVIISCPFMFFASNFPVVTFLRHTQLIQLDLVYNYFLLTVCSFSIILSILLLLGTFCIKQPTRTLALCYSSLGCCILLTWAYFYILFFKPQILIHINAHFCAILIMFLFFGNLIASCFFISICRKHCKIIFQKQQVYFFMLLVAINSFMPLLEIRQPTNLLPQPARLTVFFISSSIIFYVVFKHCFSITFYSFTSKINLHTKNNTLMNRHMENIVRSKAYMEHQYAQLNAMYTQMMFMYPDPLFIVRNLNIIHINDHAALLLNTPSESLLDKPFIDCVAPAFKAAISTLIEATSKDDFTQKTMELALLLSNGTTVEVEALFTPAKEHGAHVFIVSAKDITYRKQQAALSQQVALEKLKVEFFSTLSHELKTPVNIIYSAVQLQNNLLVSGELKKACHYNAMISQNCMRLLRLLNNLLDINRIESNYFSFSPQHLNIVSLTESILESTIPYASRKHISALFDTDCEEIYAFIDPDLFERILLNLFSNAIKYTPDHGSLWVNLSTQDQHITLSIKDTGVGIHPSKLEHIFERFYRIDNGLVRQAEGAGIGLSLVKSLVELNNGAIQVISTEGKGSEFILTFPIDLFFTKNPPLDVSYDYITSKDKVDMEFSDIFI